MGIGHKIKRVHIEITTLCNSQCITCPQEKINRDKMIDMDIARRIIAEDCLTYKDSIELFEFHNYNEPLLTFYLFEELSLLVNKIYGEYKVGLVSNGSIMSRFVATRLLRLKLAHIYFSIDGYSREVFESHRRGLNREIVYQNVDYFISRCELHKELTGEKIHPYISFVITEKNRHEKQLVIEHFKGRQCHISFQDCDGRGGEGKESVVNNIWLKNPCNYAMDGIYVLSNLDVVPCCIDWEGIEVMGNLKEQTVQEIVDGEKYRDFREKQMTGRKKEIRLCSECKTNMIYGYPRTLDKVIWE